MFLSSRRHEIGIEFLYQLTGPGWSECTLIVHESSITVTASSLSDGLRSLISAICRVVDGISDATASFAEEPGEYRWRLYRIDEATIRILILEFDELWSHRPDTDGKPIFDVRCRLHNFAGAVYHGCVELLEEYGHEGYKDQWRKHEYPSEEIDTLKRLLNSENTG